jgi:hypothetical protein
MVAGIMRHYDRGARKAGRRGIIAKLSSRKEMRFP